MWSFPGIKVIIHLFKSGLQRIIISLSVNLLIIFSTSLSVIYSVCLIFCEQPQKNFKDYKTHVKRNWNMWILVNLTIACRNPCLDSDFSLCLNFTCWFSGHHRLVKINLWKELTTWFRFNYEVNLNQVTISWFDANKLSCVVLTYGGGIQEDTTHNLIMFFLPQKPNSACKSNIMLICPN